KTTRPAAKRVTRRARSIRSPMRSGRLSDEDRGLAAALANGASASALMLDQAPMAGPSTGPAVIVWSLALDGGVEQSRDGRLLHVGAQHVVDEGLGQIGRLALRVHVPVGRELVLATGHVVDRCVDAVELEAGDLAPVLLVVGEADDARGPGGCLDRGHDGPVRVLGQRLARGL